MKTYFAYAIFWSILLSTPSRTFAQPKPDSVRVATNALEYQPVYIMAFSTRKNADRRMFRIEGYLLAGKPLDAKKRRLGKTIYVAGIMARKEGKK